MAKGAAIKFSSYDHSVSKLLEAVGLSNEISKHNFIVLKPNLSTSDPEKSTSPEFVSAVLDFCIAHKNEEANIIIAEGSDGEDTMEVYSKRGYKELAEKYGVGLIDLNKAETQELEDPNFLKFETIQYPEALLDSFVISLPVLKEDEETEISTSLSNMIGTYPSSYYKGFFSSTKNKIRKWPIKYAVHDIVKCKMPDFAVIDASNHGSIIAGLPLDADKKATEALGLEWNKVKHLRLVDESFSNE